MQAPRLIVLSLVFLLGSLRAAIASTAESPELHDLGSLEQLVADFNRDAGIPRLVLLLSPT